MANHDSCKTRFDVLIYAGDYNGNGGPGPSMKFEDKNAQQMGLGSLSLPFWFETGANVRVVAKILNSKNHNVF